MDRDKYPARYILQKLEHTSWSRFGNGDNSLDRIVERCRVQRTREQKLARRTPGSQAVQIRVWDRKEKVEVVVS